VVITHSPASACCRATVNVSPALTEFPLAILSIPGRCRDAGPGRRVPRTSPVPPGGARPPRAVRPAVGPRPTRLRLGSQAGSHCGATPCRRRRPPFELSGSTRQLAVSSGSQPRCSAGFSSAAGTNPGESRTRASATTARRCRDPPQQPPARLPSATTGFGRQPDNREVAARPAGRTNGSPPGWKTRTTKTPKTATGTRLTTRQ
jgi:hypothetical protein